MPDLVVMAIPAGKETRPINLLGFQKDAYEFDSVAEEKQETRKDDVYDCQNIDPFDSDEDNMYLESNERVKGTNPFDDDSEASQDDEEERPIPRIGIEERVETIETEKAVELLVITSVVDLSDGSLLSKKQDPPSSIIIKNAESFETEETAPESAVSSSLTLQKQVKFDTNSILQRAGDKLENQQKNEEIQKLKDEIKTLKGQAEAVKEVLKRSIDSKNDLVIAQTEVEIHHEQCMYIKDLELSHMKAYVRNIEEKQANNDLSSMNEISTLSKEMKSLKDNYSMELAEKEDEINQLKQQVKQLRAALVRGKEIVYRN